MGISYGPLAKALHNLGKTRHDLQKDIGLSAATVTKIGKNQYIAKKRTVKSPFIRGEESTNAAQV